MKWDERDPDPNCLVFACYQSPSNNWCNSSRFYYYQSPCSLELNRLLWPSILRRYVFTNKWFSRSLAQSMNEKNEMSQTKQRKKKQKQNNKIHLSLKTWMIQRLDWLIYPIRLLLGVHRMRLGYIAHWIRYDLLWISKYHCGSAGQCCCQTRRTQ